jgi:voltage-gated potassium channel
MIREVLSAASRSKVGRVMVADRAQRWERRTEWPLTALAAVFLAAYAWPILVPATSNGWRDVCRYVDYAAWLLFGIDYLVKVGFAERRMRYVSRHLSELAVIALPLLRPLRLLRLVMLLRVLNRSATVSLRGRIVTYVIGATTLLVFCASLAMLDAERGRTATNINSFADALWWSITTITTVGYGDRYPVTGEGRLLGAGLMIAGIALLGVVTASLASWIIDEVRETEVDAHAVTIAHVNELSNQMNELKALLLETRMEPSAQADEGKDPLLQT